MTVFINIYNDEITFQICIFRYNLIFQTGQRFGHLTELMIWSQACVTSALLKNKHTPCNVLKKSFSLCNNRENLRTRNV